MLLRTRLKSRRPTSRWLPAVVAGTVALAVLPLVAVQPALATSSTGVSTATFTGTIKVQTYEQCDQGTQSVSWSMTATATDDQLGNESAQPLYWHYTKLSGTETLTYTGASGCPTPTPSNCSSPIHEWPDYESTPSDHLNMSAVLNSDGGFDYFLHIGSPPAGYAWGDSCVYTTEPADRDNTAKQGPVLADVDTSPPGVYTRNPSVSTDTRGQGLGVVTTGSGHLVFQAGTGTEAPSPATTHKAKQAQQDAKAAAQADLEPAMENAKGPCLQYAIGLGLFGSGTLLIGASGIAGGAFVAAGSLGALAAEPFCVATLKRIAKDIAIYRDPPDSRTHVIAQPVHVVPESAAAKCRQKAKSVARFCRQLRSAWDAYVTQAKRVTSDDAALSTTINRLSTALTHRDGTGDQKQTAQTHKLLTAIATRRRHERAAGRHLAAVLRSHHLRWPMSRKRAAAAIKEALRVLAKDHVSKAQLKSASKSALSAAPFDALKAMAS